ncbi:Uncharacterised protein [Mycobacteroides abscessus subsp. bolletii]|nr:Uncharacterised protein [Mycobacteroides abscessus subsp. bolletii]
MFAHDPPLSHDVQLPSPVAALVPAVAAVLLVLRKSDTAAPTLAHEPPVSHDVQFPRPVFAFVVVLESSDHFAVNQSVIEVNVLPLPPVTASAISCSETWLPR